jgi:CRP-like cAMP-binding protein
VPEPKALGENRVLNRLDADERSWLQPYLKHVTLPRGLVIHPPDVKISDVYFPLGGMVSILAVMKTGEQIETGIIGREGVVGGSIGYDGWESIGQATVQIAGHAWQLPSSKFLELYKASETLRGLTTRYQTFLFVQAQQSAACHALHSVEARLCRWLLQSQDITESDMVPLTQEFLSHMMGVRRTSVTLCARTLQAAALIKYKRGAIKILDRDGLKESACECYDVVRAHMERAVPAIDRNVVSSYRASP